MYCTISSAEEGSRNRHSGPEARQEHESIHDGGRIRDEDISKGPSSQPWSLAVLLATLSSCSCSFINQDCSSRLSGRLNISGSSAPKRLSGFCRGLLPKRLAGNAASPARWETLLGGLPQISWKGADAGFLEPKLGYRDLVVQWRTYCVMKGLRNTSPFRGQLICHCDIQTNHSLIIQSSNPSPPNLPLKGTRYWVCDSACAQGHDTDSTAIKVAKRP